MQLIALLLPWAIAAADDDGEGAKTLSARDEALIEYTFKAISYARARDDYQTAIGQVTGEELEEMGLTRFQFEDFINNIKEAMESDQFKAHVEIEDYLTALSNLVIQLNPRGFELIDDPTQPEFDQDELKHEELKVIEQRLESLEKPKKGPLFKSIDHLQPNTFIENAKCPDKWTYNGKTVFGCQTDLRNDGRPWCSLDEIFTGNFIFCDEDSEEIVEEINVERERARKLHQSAQRGLVENLRDEKYVQFKEQLKEAIELGDKDALVTLYRHQIFGYIFEQDIEQAIIGLIDLANEGVSSAQGLLGILQASGLGVDTSQSKAILNLSFGAFGNDLPARLALANRYYNGLGVPKSCKEAMRHYRFVAERVSAEAKQITHSPWVIQSRIIDDETTRDNNGVLDDDEFNYFSYLSSNGGTSYQVRLAQLLLQRGYDDDIVKAAELFQSASNSGDSKASAYLGKMYLEGLGVSANNDTAFKLFKKSADQGDPIGQCGMGIMYMEGRSIPHNPKTAVKYFQASANQGYTEGQLRLGMAYMNGEGGVKKDTHQALKYLRQASKEYHSGFGNVLAFWYMGEIYAPISCQDATRYYKFVAELGPWNRLFTHAWKQWKIGNKHTALAIYTYLAELGYEKAQSNIATILDDHPLSNEMLSVNRHKRAFFNWKRAAHQSFPMARIRVGDHHWYGLGVDRDYSNAATHYRIASHNTDAKAAAQALFNLGYMHHFGLGVPKDYHLSKRFYDAAAEKSLEAHLPSTIALIGLACSYIGDTINENGLMISIALGNAAIIAFLSTLYIIRDHFR